MATAPSPIKVPQKPNQKVDENGEVIIAEALFGRSSLRLQIMSAYVVTAAIMSILIPCVFICLCVGCIIGCRGAYAWRLYLTSTGLHYTSVSSAGCVRGKKLIPLSDIKDVSLQQTLCTSSLREVVHTMKILTVNQGTVEFNSILNAIDFCAAIKQQQQLQA